MTERFKVSSQEIVHETIEGEVVIVNLENGFYYSSDKLGSVVWKFVESGCTYGQILEVLSAKYPQNRAEIEESVARMIGELRDEGLIVSAQDGPAADSAVVDSADMGEAEFEPPSLQKHKDMKDLLLVDPIHEVEDSGWPNRK